MYWRNYEPSPETIKFYANCGFEWDSEKRAYLDLVIGDYVEPENVKHAYHLFDEKTGKPYRRYSKLNQEEMWDQVDAQIDWDKENC